MRDCYMMALFIVPDLVDEDSLEVEDLWGDRTGTSVNMFKHCLKISHKQAILFQRDLYDCFVGNNDIFGCEWNLELFVNSFGGALISRIEVKYETLDELEQGFIT